MYARAHVWPPTRAMCSLQPQALIVLESLCQAGMPPDPVTTDHLVLQVCVCVLCVFVLCVRCV
jgi:hypothetical protein